MIPWWEKIWRYKICKFLEKKGIDAAAVLERNGTPKKERKNNRMTMDIFSEYKNRASTDIEDKEAVCYEEKN